MVSALLLSTVVIGNRWHTHYTRIFRPTVGAENYVAAISWYGMDVRGNFAAGGGPRKMMIDLIYLGGDNVSRELATSTQVEDGVKVLSARIHCFDRPNFIDKQGGFVKVFPVNFLATEVNGGQHDHTLIWWFDPKTLRPIQLLDAIYGDASRLKDGLVLENSPPQYVDKRDWPKEAKEFENFCLQRTWRYQIGKNVFTPGKWRLRPNITGPTSSNSVSLNPPTGLRV